MGRLPSRSKPSEAREGRKDRVRGAGSAGEAGCGTPF